MSITELVFSLEKFIVDTVARDNDMGEVIMGSFLSKSTSIEWFRGQGKTIEQYIKDEGDDSLIALVDKEMGREFVLENYFIVKKDYEHMTHEESFDMAMSVVLMVSSLNSIVHEGRVIKSYKEKYNKMLKID